MAVGTDVWKQGQEPKNWKGFFIGACLLVIIVLILATVFSPMARKKGVTSNGGAVIGQVAHRDPLTQQVVTATVSLYVKPHPGGCQVSLTGIGRVKSAEKIFSPKCNELTPTDILNWLREVLGADLQWIVDALSKQYNTFLANLRLLLLSIK